MKKIFSIGGILAIIILIIAAIMTSTSAKPSASELVWDEQMTIGNLNAKNFYIIYSDLVCPYCVAFENAIVEHEDEFQDYLTEHDILVEIRLSDFLYEYGTSNPISSRHSALAAYCAKNEGKFWDYYNAAISKVWNDYFKNGGKNALSALNQLGQSYWIDLGTSVGLGDSFISCIENEEPLEEIKTNAEKTTKLASGLPSFKFNSYVPQSGFSLSWGWDQVLEYFNEGLKH